MSLAAEEERSGLARETALGILRAAFGAKTEFRTDQWEAIESVLRPGARVLVVQRTGWGKSVVYFIATKLLRKKGAEPTLIVSPLLALMRNQIDMAAKMGLRAASINSTNIGDWPEIEGTFLSGRTDVLFVSPERLANREFQERLIPYYESHAGMVVIDEAHCVSDWGHDFRPDYRRVISLVERLPESSPILATTATANERVMEDLRELFGPKLEIQRGSLHRSSLKLSAFHLEDHAERLAWLTKYVPKLPATGIIYALTVADAESVASWMRSQKIEVEAYHADLAPQRRLELEDRFSRNDLKALAATTALGMGYDKEDVGFVVHYQMPGSVVAYYQQVGRAGRAVGTAYGVLLEGDVDEEITEHFIESAVPPRWVFEAIVNGLRSGPKALSEILRNVRSEAGAVHKALEMLEIEGAAVAWKGGYILAEGAKGPNWGRIQRVRDQRRLELQQMFGYARVQTCRMQYLMAALGDPAAEPCARCDACKPHAPISLDPEAVESARGFFCTRTYPIPPKARIPAKLEVGRRRTIQPHERLLEGIAISSYNDPGWGAMVRDGKYEALEFSDALVEASARAIRRTQFDPQWLCWVPSTTHGKPLEALAQRLAQALGIEAVPALEKVRPTEPQKTMLYKEAQFLNVWGSIRATQMREGRCLLVDDIVDSGWTMAVAGMVLIEAGSGPVMPFALATARPRRARD